MLRAHAFAMLQKDGDHVGGVSRVDPHGSQARVVGRQTLTLCSHAQLRGVLLRLDGSRLAVEQELGNLTEICHEEAKSNSH